MEGCDRIKDLMYEAGLTRLEAEAYLACVESGATITGYARAIGKNHTLISQRVHNAKRKVMESRGE